MEKERPNIKTKLSEEGYVIIPAYFLNNWTEVLGTGPSMLYIQLLNYCYKGKDIAWPTLTTLSKKMQLTPKTITRYQKVLTKYGLIKKIVKRKTSLGSCRRNIYQVTPLDKVKNYPLMSNFFPYIEEKITPNIGKNLPLKHNNINNTNTTTTKAAVADFKKRKGEEKMKTLREQLKDLDFKESFIEKLLKDFDLKKIEEKLDLLLVRRNIQNPTGWLYAALKNDYQDPQSSLSFPPSPLSFPRKRESIKSPHQESMKQGRGTMHRAQEKQITIKQGGHNSLCPYKIISNGNLRENPPEPASRQKALKAIRLIRKNLSSLSPGGRGPG